MDERRLTGAIATVLAFSLVAFGIAGVARGIAVDVPDGLLASTIAAFGVVTAAVLALVAAGSRGGRFLATPYW